MILGLTGRNGGHKQHAYPTYPTEQIYLSNYRRNQKGQHRLQEKITQ